MFFRAQGRSSRQDHPRLGAPEDFFGKEKAQAAEPAGNQINAVVFERRRRRFGIGSYFLPPHDLPRALAVSDQPLGAAALLRLQIPRQILGRDGCWNENELANEPRIFEPRRFEQSGQTSQHRLFLTVGDDDLHEHLPLGLAPEDGAYSLKARHRVLAVTFGNILMVSSRQ